MISIVIPLYNKEAQIAHTLKSVMNQTFQDFEIVIVNDGSTDNSEKIAAGYDDKRIRLISQTNQGVSAARNKGIKEAKYEYVALLDADDEWKPDYLRTQVDMIEKYPKCSVFACSYKFRDHNGNERDIVLKNIPFKDKHGVMDNYFRVASSSHPPLWSSAVVAKREALLSIGGFPTGVTSGEDLLTWARLACKYSIAYCTTPLAYFILDGRQSFTSDRNRKHDKKDIVGDELTKLYVAANGNLKRDLKLYLSLWFKMKASVFMHTFERAAAIKYSGKSLKYNCLNWKVYFFVLMTFLPQRIQLTIMNKYEQ